MKKSFGPIEKNSLKKLTATFHTYDMARIIRRVERIQRELNNLLAELTPKPIKQPK